MRGCPSLKSLTSCGRRRWDPNTLKRFARWGTWQGPVVFAAPDVVENEIRRRYKVQVVGRTKDVRQRFYAISIERKLQHPAVASQSASCERTPTAP